MGQGQGCRIAWDLRGLSGSQLCGQGSPANRVFWACSTTLDMWKVMLSFPMTSEKILQELQNVLQDKRVCGSLQAQPVHTSLLNFAVSNQRTHLAPLQGCVRSSRRGTVLSLPHLPQTVASSRTSSPLGPAPAPLHQPYGVPVHKDEAYPFTGSAHFSPSPASPYLALQNGNLQQWQGQGYYHSNG